jgi:hypothetical protein
MTVHIIIIIIVIVVDIIFRHEFITGWPVSVSTFTSSSSVFSGRPGRRLPFG